MTRRAGLSTPVFLLSAAIGTAIFILAMLVAGVRIDSGPTLPAPPSAAEQARQNAASAYALVAEAAEGNSAELARLARSHEEAIGGVWVPWPEGAPDGATNPPPPASDTDDVTVLLDRAIGATVDALEAAPSADVPLYASILIRQQAALDEAAPATQDSDADEPADKAPGAAGLTADTLSPGQVAELASGQTLIEIDAARQWLEAAAPHLDSADTALTRIAAFDDYTSAILQSGTADVRRAFAPLPDWFRSEPSPEMAQRLEEEAYLLVASELFTYIPTTDRTLDIQIAATALELIARSELPDFPLLEKTA